MKTSFWAPYISDHTIHAICWTLIHSLWIGLAIALLSGLVITLTRKSSAVLRYRLLCTILVLFVVSAGVTFYLEMCSPDAKQAPAAAISFNHGNFQNFVVIPNVQIQQSPIDKVISFLNQNANIIFIAWLLFFVLKSLKMAGGLFYIQRIRNYKVHEVSEEFKRKIETFASQIGISQTVRLMQSELVKVPVAVGWLKPVILLPMGIILQLTPEQLESILWHELAHIRRRDYLVNILQGVVETVFFFNPGLLWLSSLIRSEREACCDDIVLSRMNRKANYLEALLAFGNEDNSGMSLAMSIGSGNQLRDRLKRMINKENKRLNMAEKVVLVIGLVVLSAFTTLPKTTQNAVKHMVDVIIKKTSRKDTLKVKTVSIDSGKKQPVTTYQTEVMKTDTPRFRQDTTMRFFRTVLFNRSDADLANSDISVEDTTGKKYHFIVADHKLVSMEINGEKVQESDLPKYQYIVTKVDVAVLEKRRIWGSELARFKANNPDARFKAFKRYDGKHRDIDSLEAVHWKEMNEIIADLVNRKIVPDAGSVKWFALTDSQLLVNGQKQPDELQELYKAKYGIREDYGLYYGPVPMKGKGVFIDPEARRSFDSLRFVRFNDPLATNDERRALKLQMMQQRYHDDSISYKAQKDRALSVIADLVHDKVLSNPASIKWFGLSSTEFIVNGQKQTDEIQQRYKAKYGVHDGYGLYYGPVQMHGTGVFIDDADSRASFPRQPKAMRVPKYMGKVDSKYTDSLTLKNYQLIKQQKRFADDQNRQRDQIIQQQQQFSEQQNKQRERLMRQQQNMLADQARNQLFSQRSLALQGVLGNIATDLVNDNIVKDKSDLVGFVLTNKSLIVNGKEQPEDIHQKLKDKYLNTNGQYSASKLLIDVENEQENKHFTEDPNFGFHYDTKDGNLSMGVGITRTGKPW